MNKLSPMYFELSSLLLIFLCALTVHCKPSEPQSSPNVSPQAEDTIQERLAVLGGPVTEIVFALGAGDRVVAVDQSSAYPEEVNELPRLDYLRNVSAEGILAQNPTRVLSAEGIGPSSVIEHLHNAGVKVEIFDEPTDIESAIHRVQSIAKTLDLDDKASSVTNRLEALNSLDIEGLNNTKPRILFLYARGANTLMVGGINTAAATAISIAGGALAVEFEGFRPLTPEGLVQARPDIILMTSKGVESLGNKDAIWDVPGLNLTPAFKNKNMLAIDDLKLLGFGPRYAEAVDALRQQIDAYHNVEKTL